MRTLHTTKNGDQLIVVNTDGRPKECPFAAPIPTQNAIGQLSLQIRACNSDCMFFHHDMATFEGSTEPTPIIELDCINQVYVHETTDYKNPIIPLK
jgi:hypothetical protein